MKGFLAFFNESFDVWCYPRLVDLMKLHRKQFVSRRFVCQFVSRKVRPIIRLHFWKKLYPVHDEISGIVLVQTEHVCVLVMRPSISHETTKYPISVYVQPYLIFRLPKRPKEKMCYLCKFLFEFKCIQGGSYMKISVTVHELKNWRITNHRYLNFTSKLFACHAKRVRHGSRRKFF